MNKNRKTINYKLFSLFLIIIILIAGAIYILNNKKNFLPTFAQHPNDLYAPTMIEKIKDDYFIIDCRHNRIIYNNNLNDPISDWKTLTNKINAGHSITSDGDVYVCDDTENNAIIVFTKNHDKFKQTQTIKNITGRPHYVKYDEATKLFYVISSEETKITTLKNNSGKVELVNTYFIDDFSNSYIRSFNIIDGYMYLISGPGYITKLKYDDNSYKIISKYDVPSELSVMNFMEKIDDYYYLSSFSNGEGVIAPMFVRIKDLNDLKDSKYEDLYNDFGFTGVPYFITKFDNAYFIPEIHFSNGIKSFEVNNNKISNIKTHYYFKK